MRVEGAGFRVQGSGLHRLHEQLGEPFDALPREAGACVCAYVCVCECECECECVCVCMCLVVMVVVVVCVHVCVWWRW